MGLFDFVSSIGTKLFSNKDDAAENIKKHIEENNPGISNLDVKVDDGNCILCGKAESQAAMEKTVLMAGNVKGIESVDYDGIEYPEDKQKVEYYTIKSGDTLSKIAKKYYKNAMEYPRIFEANREVIKDPDLIFVGQVIRIPLD